MSLNGENFVGAQVPKPLKKTLDRAAEDEGTSRSEIVRVALRDYLEEGHEQNRGGMVNGSGLNGQEHGPELAALNVEIKRTPICPRCGQKRPESVTD